MTLTRLRKQWEPTNRNYSTALCVVHNKDGYKTVYVVRHRTIDQSDYSLIRYFKVGSIWQASVDVNGDTSISGCLAIISEAFNSSLPV